MWTNPATTIAAVALMALTPVAIRTLGWLLGLRMVLRASRPEERPALLNAFATVAIALQESGRVSSENSAAVPAPVPLPQGDVVAGQASTSSGDAA